MPYSPQTLEKFKKAREEKRLSYQTIATLSNTPLATVTRFFNGKTPNPTVETFVGIATVLGLSIDEIIGLKEPSEQPLDSKVETVISSYAELLKEKDERLKEKDEIIKELKTEKIKEQKEKGKLLTFTLVFIVVVILVLLFDLMNGHFGYFRY